MNRPPHLLTGLCALAFAAPAQAQDVQVDPGSPAGVEYQLPIDRAREEAGGVAGEMDGSSDEAPLFGKGVESGQPTTPKKKTSAKAGTDSDPATTAEVEADRSHRRRRRAGPCGLRLWSSSCRHIIRLTRL